MKLDFGNGIILQILQKYYLFLKSLFEIDILINTSFGKNLLIDILSKINILLFHLHNTSIETIKEEKEQTIIPFISKTDLSDLSNITTNLQSKLPDTSGIMDNVNNIVNSFIPDLEEPISTDERIESIKPTVSDDYLKGKNITIIENDIHDLINGKIKRYDAKENKNDDFDMYTITMDKEKLNEKGNTSYIVEEKKKK